MNAEEKWAGIEVAGTVAPGAVSSVHHRFAYFRQRHMDANDGPKLGDERTYKQSDSAWPGEFRCRFAGARACAGGRFAGRSAGQTQDPGGDTDCANNLCNRLGIFW